MSHFKCTQKWRIRRASGTPRPEAGPRSRRKDNKRASDSVTRFGEILPLWQKFTSLWQFFDSLFLFWQMLSLLWQICDINGLICIVANSQILKNNLTILSHWPQMTIKIPLEKPRSDESGLTSNSIRIVFQATTSRWGPVGVEARKWYQTKITRKCFDIITQKVDLRGLKPVWPDG